MTGILDKFYVEHGMHGVRVMARSNELTSNFIADGEIDTAIQMLKDDLDACAKEMKRIVEVNQRGSLFEGWPSAKTTSLTPTDHSKQRARQWANVGNGSKADPMPSRPIALSAE